MNSFHVTLILYWSLIRCFYDYNYLIISVYFKIFVLTRDLPTGFTIAQNAIRVAQNEIA